MEELWLDEVSFFKLHPSIVTILSNGLQIQ